MAVVLSSILFGLAVAQLIICTNLICNPVYRKDRKVNMLYLANAGSALSSLGNGIMLIAGSQWLMTAAYIISYAGMLAFSIFVFMTILCWSKLNAAASNAISYVLVGLVIILVPLFLIYFKPEYVDSSFGHTFRWNVNIFICMYTGFKICIFIALIACVRSILKHGGNKRTKHLALKLFHVLIIGAADILCDIFRLGASALFFPYDSMFSFFMIIFLYRIIIVADGNILNTKNLSETIYTMVDIPIIILDEAMNVVLVNRFGAEFFGMTEEECREMQIGDFFEITEETIKSKKYSSNVRCRINNAICGLTVSLLLDSYGEILGYMITSVDQTETFKAMNEASEARKIAEAANRAKSDFLAHMSHEIRTPINTIVGMDEMILRETNERTLVKYAMDIKIASNSLLAIVNDILDFSKIESGKMELVYADYSIDSLLADQVNTFSFKAKEKDIKFCYDIDPSLPKKLEGDELRVKQIISNLLSNAVKYTSRGRVMFSVKGYYVDGNYIDIQIAVTDTGCGIKREDIAKLFDAFTRVDLRTNRTIEGTGLGLNITNKLVHMMDGVLDVKSSYGKGSTFSCSFRQKIVDNDVIGNFDMFYERYQGSSYTYHKVFEAPQASILVVDDNSMNIRVIESLLKETKMNVVSVLSGEQAVKSAHDNHYDLILMDHMMPHMDGIEAFSLIRADKTGESCNTPIIAMTANAVSGARQMYLDHGFSDYLSKPVNPMALENMLAEKLPQGKVKYINVTASEWINEDKENKETLKLIEALLEKNGINVVSGLRNVNNNISAYNETLEMFGRGVEESLTKLRKLLENGDSKNYGIEAHALKSMARLIGAGEMADICYKHELAGKEYRLEDAYTEWDFLEMESKKAARIVSDYINELNKLVTDKNESSGKKPIEEEILKKKLFAVRELTEDYEHRQAMKLIEELMDFNIEDKKLKCLKEVYKALNDLDYETAIRLAGDL